MDGATRVHAALTAWQCASDSPPLPAPSASCPWRKPVPMKRAHSKDNSTLSISGWSALNRGSVVPWSAYPPRSTSAGYRHWYAESWWSLSSRRRTCCHSGFRSRLPRQCLLCSRRAVGSPAPPHLDTIGSRALSPLVPCSRTPSRCSWQTKRCCWRCFLFPAPKSCSNWHNVWCPDGPFGRSSWPRSATHVGPAPVYKRRKRCEWPCDDCEGSFAVPCLCCPLPPISCSTKRTWVMVGRVCAILPCPPSPLTPLYKPLRRSTVCPCHIAVLPRWGRRHCGQESQCFSGCSAVAHCLI